MEKFTVCPLSGWHDQEGGPRFTHAFESTHDEKTQGSTFTRTWMGQRPDRNCGHEVILPHDMWSLPPQSPAGPVTGLKPGIRPRLGEINFAP